VPRIALSSLHNPRVRAAAALRDAGERRRRGLMLVDGAREISRAVAAGVPIIEAFVNDARVEAAGQDARDALQAVQSTGADEIEVTAALLARLAYGDRDQGLVAVATIPETRLAAIVLRANPLLAVIEGVEKPGNLGAILRTADGAGFDALVVADPATDLFNPNVIRASLGTVFSVPVAVASTGEVLEWLLERHIDIVAARVDASTDYTEADFRGPVAIALGSEARGLSDAWSELAVANIRVPMLGVADSLNVSATAAILFYEARRQRAVGGLGASPTARARPGPSGR